MIIKAFITALPEEGSNKYEVRIPFMEDNTGSEFILQALLCNQPGLYGGYEIGDCVWIIFENNKYNVPVIVGKLFTDPKETSTSFQVVNNLKVTGTVELPDDTQIAGWGSKEFFENSQGREEFISGSENLSYNIIGEW